MNQENAERAWDITSCKHRRYRSVAPRLWRFFHADPALGISSADLPGADHADTGRADVNTLASGSALPQRKLNPNPKQACEIRFTLAGLFDLSMLAGDKAPFAVFVSFLQTRKCSPTTRNQEKRPVAVSFTRPAALAMQARLQVASGR